MLAFQTVVRSNLNATKQVVYKFQGYDIVTDKVIESGRMATAEFIKQMGYSAVGEGYEIDSSDLETNGYTAVGFVPTQPTSVF